MMETFIFSAWIGVFGFLLGMLVQVFVSNSEMKVLKSELKAVHTENAELRSQLSELNPEVETVEVIEINDPTFTNKPKDNLFEPF